MVRAWVLGRFDEAWTTAREARDRIWELTGAHWIDWIPAQIAALGGDHESAVGYLQPFCELLEERQQRFYLATVATMLGRELCQVGSYKEAERSALLVRKLGVRQNTLAEAAWRQVQALVQASRGEHVEAQELAREAIAIMERSDGLNYQGDAFFDLAEVLAAAGRIDEAAAALEHALERYERKKNLAMVAQLRPRLDALRKGATA